MERFLPSADGSSAAGSRPCGEPTCRIKSHLVSLVHQCPCGGPCTHFVVGASERKATDSRGSARIASRGKMETRLAAAAVPWKWMVLDVFCLYWVKSRLAKLSIICFVFTSFLPWGRSGVLFFGVFSRILRLVLSALPTFYSIVSSQAWVVLFGFHVAGSLCLYRIRVPKTDVMFTVRTTPQQ